MYENSVQDIKNAQTGNKDAMEKLMNTNVGLIWSIVKRFTGRGYEVEDIYQIGCMGFIKAIQRFDTTFEVKLSTYAVPYILGEIKRFLRDDGSIKVSRSIKELGIKIKETQKEYLNKTGEEISIQKIAEILHTTKEEVAVALDSTRPIVSIYDDSNSSGEEGLTILDKLATSKDEMTSIADKIALRELIVNLEEREKQIILLRYFKEKTQTEVSKILQISQVQVSRIEKKVLTAMKLKLTS